MAFPQMFLICWLEGSTVSDRVYRHEKPSFVKKFISDCGWLLITLAVCLVLFMATGFMLFNFLFSAGLVLALPFFIFVVKADYDSDMNLYLEERKRFERLEQLDLNAAKLQTCQRELSVFQESLGNRAPLLDLCRLVRSCGAVVQIDREKELTRVAELQAAIQQKEEEIKVLKNRLEELAAEA